MRRLPAAPIVRAQRIHRFKSIHAASLRAIERQVGNAAHEKQEAPGVCRSEGLYRSPRLDTEVRAASAQSDTERP